MPNLDLDRMEKLAARLLTEPSNESANEFNWAARTFVPEAIAEIRRLRAEVVGLAAMKVLGGEEEEG